MPALPAEELSALIDADVVNRHGLREDGRRVWVAGPVAADRFVEEDEERVVEDPLRARGQVCGRARLVERAVNVPAYDVRLPLDGEDVEVVGESAARQSVRRADAVRARIAGPVHRAVDDCGFATDVLHDLYLVARGPALRLDVVAEYPECRPHTLPVSN